MFWRFGTVSVLAIFMLASCTSTKVVQTQQGSTTVETNALRNTVKMTNGRGTAIIGKGAVDEARLGLPLYPGMIASQTGGMRVVDAEGTRHAVSLSTKDSFDKVYTWYKGHMPPGSEQLHMEQPTASIATFLIGKEGDRDQRSVQIQNDGKTTTVLLSRITKNA
ncbi:MAG: hypothetical protein JOY87_04840 [Candidatus Eremiobacteraeota bacterium]|nr:hypothetical protein [Candidatus Eremiobacteraeota bacterium]